MFRQHEGSQKFATDALVASFVLACTVQAMLLEPWPRWVWTVVVFGVVLYCALVDVRFRIVPNAAVVLLCLLGVVDAAIEAVGPHADPALGVMVAAGMRLAGATALAAFVVALSLAFESRGREGMGGGDAKLVFALALCFGAGAALVVLGLACMLVVAFQACRALGLLASGRRAPSLSSSLPFAPAIAVAVWLVAAFPA